MLDCGDRGGTIRSPLIHSSPLAAGVGVNSSADLAVALKSRARWTERESAHVVAATAERAIAARIVPVAGIRVFRRHRLPRGADGFRLVRLGDVQAILVLRGRAAGKRE